MWGRMAKKLTIQYLNSRLEAGRYYDSSGTGLHIHVRSSGSKSWSQKLRFRGKQIELGLGSYPSVSLAEAREWCCQTNANSSQFPGIGNLLGCADAAPLGKSGGAVELEI